MTGISRRVRKVSFLRRTTAISLICGALLAGLILGRFNAAVPVEAVIITGFIAALLAIRRGRWFLLALAVFALMLGIWRVGGYARSQAALTGLVGQKIALTGQVSDDPSYDPRGFMNFRVDHLKTEAGQALPGEVKVRLYSINLHRGYQVRLEGKLKPPYYSGPPELNYPKTAVLSTQQSELEQFRQRFFSGMRTAIAEPMASFGLGLLVGVRGLIPKPLQEELTLVGLSHLVAVSGYNLTIIVAAAHKLLERFGRSLALVSSLWLIGAFLAVTGASASIVRAGVVAVLALLAAHYGRRFQPLVLILLAAAATAAVKPAYLTDYGWLLSFLAFFGIMILAPAIEARLGHPKRLVVRLFIESSAAQLMTIPLLLYSFGELSLVAPLTNLVELPLVPLAMLSSFMAGLAGMFLPAFAGWLAWPAQLVLEFMLGLVHWAASWPWASTAFYIGPLAMLFMYVLIILVVIVLNRINRRDSKEAPEHLTIMS